jgi:hypothetical protein
LFVAMMCGIAFGAITGCSLGLGFAWWMGWLS